MTERDQLIEKAATAVANADFLLVATGAGMGVDSGLKTYNDVADVDAYSMINVTYPDLCDPLLMKKDPTLFFGFWGMCFNEYRDRQPHEGYQIIKKWKERMMDLAKQDERKKEIQAFFQSEVAERQTGIDDEHEQNKKDKTGYVRALDKPDAVDAAVSAMERLQISEEQDDTKNATASSKDDTHRGVTVTKRKRRCTNDPFFAYTSNVDYHFQRAGFDDTEIYEIHGCTEYWQCEKPRDCKKRFVWKVDEPFRFDLNTDLMRAFETEPAERKFDGFDTNHPKCIFCKKNARPNVLMFSDWYYDEIDTGDDNWDIWAQSVMKSLIKFKDATLAIIEIGAGNRIATVRTSMQSFFNQNEGSTHMIRVNPDFPEFTNLYGFPPSAKAISMQCGGLEALKAIDERVDMIDVEQRVAKELHISEERQVAEEQQIDEEQQIAEEQQTAEE